MSHIDVDGLRTKIAWTALICGVGYFIASIIALYGNIILDQASVSIVESGVDAFNPQAYNLTAAWWLITLSNFSFAILNTLWVLVFCGFVYLYGAGDWRLWAAVIVKIVWVTVALTVDTGLAASAWVNGIQSMAGMQPDQLVHIYTVVQERSYDLLRWPTRGYYLFAGVIYFIVAKVGFERGWPKSLCYAALLLAIALWLEVLTFAITLIAGSSPIHIPAYVLNFVVATPLWGVMLWRHLRKNTISADI